jgi:hypothetical protein
MSKNRPPESQANLRKSKIVNAETEGRADVVSIAADYPS